MFSLQQALCTHVAVYMQHENVCAPCECFGCVWPRECESERFHHLADLQPELYTVLRRIWFLLHGSCTSVTTNPAVNNISPAYVATPGHLDRCYAKKRLTLLDGGWGRTQLSDPVGFIEIRSCCYETWQSPCCLTWVRIRVSQTNTEDTSNHFLCIFSSLSPFQKLQLHNFVIHHIINHLAVDCVLIGDCLHLPQVAYFYWEPSSEYLSLQCHLWHTDSLDNQTAPVLCISGLLSVLLASGQQLSKRCAYVRLMKRFASYTPAFSLCMFS